MEPKHPTSGNGNVNRGGGRGEPGRERLEMEGADGMEAIRHQAEHLGDRIAHFVRERPMAAMLIALGAGIVVGRLLRA